MSFIAVAIGGGALIGGIASIGSASIQAGAAQSAQQLQYQEQQQALQFQKQQWQTQQTNMAPWLQQGQGAVRTLGNLQNQALSGQGPLAPWTQQFQAPTIQQAEQEPGYQFALQQGTNALTNSAAASGNLLTGNTGEALQQYGQQAGQQDYQNVYNRALQQYQQSYNQYQQNQSNLFNRSASLAGLGQTAAGQLGSEGQAASGNVAYTDINAGAQQGQQINAAAYQQASGYTGAASSIGGGLTNLQQYLLMQNQQATAQANAGLAGGEYNNAAPPYTPLPEGTIS